LQLIPPSNNPSEEPSEADTDVMSYSRTPSLSPSLSPSSLQLIPPSNNPSNDFPPSDLESICNSIDPFFDRNGEINAVSIKYMYEVETDPNISGRYEMDILPAIEDTINSAIFPLFRSRCDDSRRLRRTDRLEVVGLSTLPLDAPIEKECQMNITDVSKKCTSTEGALTLFYRGILSDETIIILDTIRAGMKSGAFINCHPAIVWMSFIEVQKDGTDRVIKDPEMERVRGGGSGFPLFSFVIIFIFGFVVVVFISSRHHKENREQNTEEKNIEIYEWTSLDVGHEDDEEEIHNFLQCSPCSEFYLNEFCFESWESTSPA